MGSSTSFPCTHCGCRNFSGSPFFYEDFEEGLLVAVFPSIPDKRGEIEKSIRAKYGYYPVLEFFYDMTQIWMLIYFQEHYRANRNLRALSRIGRGEERLRKDAPVPERGPPDDHDPREADRVLA